MKFTYIYHSGFLFETDDVMVIIDFYRDIHLKRGIVGDAVSNTDKKVYVLSSHAHQDHFNTDVLKWHNERGAIHYIFSTDIQEEYDIKGKNIHYLSKSDIYKDDQIYIKAYGSTDVGISFLIRLDGNTIFHSGDLNNWHWNEEVDALEAKGYEDHYLRELQEITQEVREIDVVFFPVDPRLGTDYMKGPTQFIDSILVHSFIPMHFGTHYDKANNFKKYAEGRGCRFIELKNKGQTFIIK